MSNKKLIYLITTFLCIFSCLLTKAEDADTMVIRAVGNFELPPYEYLDKDGNPAGFNVDIFKAVMHRLGLNYEIQLKNWISFEEDLLQGKADLAMGLTPSPSRKEHFIFSTPHSLIRYCIISRKDNYIDSPEKLKNQKLLVEAGGRVDEFLKIRNYGAELYTIKDFQEGIKKISQGEFDALIAFEFISHHTIDKLNLKNLEVAPFVMMAETYSIATTPKNQELIAQIDYVLYQMRIDGEYDKIYNDWLSKYEREYKVKRFINITIALAIIAIILMLFNILLRFRIKKATKKIMATNRELEIINQTQAKDKIILKEALDRSEENSKIKLEFLSNLSHEIRTPLNSIIGFSEVIMQHCKDPECEEYYAHIIDNNNTLISIVEDTLTLAILEQTSFNETKCNYSEVFNEIAFSQKEKSTNPNVEFIITNPYKNIEAKIDIAKAKHIITNLTQNAIKYTESGMINLGYSYTDGILEVYVKDTGIGIPEEKLPFIFEIFYKVNTHSNGAGLGLAIVKKTAMQLNVEYGVESKIAEGSYFWVKGPLEMKIIEP